MQSDICIACSLPGNRRARSGFLAHSAAISGGPTILFPSGFILVGHCVPANWSGPSERSYITSCFPTPAGFRSLPVARKQILCNHFAQSISFGSMDYSSMAVSEQIPAIASPTRLYRLWPAAASIPSPTFPLTTDFQTFRMSILFLTY